MVSPICSSRLGSKPCKWVIGARRFSRASQSRYTVFRGSARMTVLFIKPGLVIADSELSERFIHASGPGGQNVNKVASAVQLSFDVAHSPSLPGAVRAALLRLGGSRLSKEGVLVITARQHREQERNRADA